MACFFATGSCAPIARFAPHLLNRVLIPSPAYAMVDEAIEWIMGLGTPGIVLLILTAIHGPVVGGTFLLVLSTLGGPLGIPGGLGVMALLTLITYKLTKFGIDYFVERWAQKQKAKGKSLKQIEDEIDNFP